MLALNLCGLLESGSQQAKFR